ncbi:MAG TPA: alcohol dehydrogenase catalytic domain-containing protein [Bryobacteraceae bacterium]|nr:alcohol dehydrogenase catalytic domain-containing protein [Bryobacteraceae bacterium]
MKAVVLKGPKVLEYADIPVPRMTAEEHVLIKVEACGICGSDLRYWAGDNPWALHTLGRHVPNPPNIVLGHEYAGVVEAVNSGRYEHLVGRRVYVQAYRVCGACVFCRSGRHNLCRDTIHIGHGQGWGTMDYYPGAYAEYCLGWGDLLYPIPDDVSFAEAAMADVLSVAVHAFGRAKLRSGGDVLLIGGGPVGLSVAQVARAKGAGRIFIAETSPLAREVLAKFDVNVIDPERQAIHEAIAAVAGRAAVAAVFDTVGSAETITRSLPLLEESGTFVNLAVHSMQVALDPALIGSERTFTTSSNGFYGDVTEACELIFSRRVNSGAMITDCLPLGEYQKAFDRLLGVPKQAYKVVFTPS